MSVQVTGPVKVPVKIGPLGTPLVPLPVIVKVPPPANVAPSCRFPLVNPPVEKDTAPRLPIMLPNPDRVEPLRVNPALLPLRVPPEFERVMLFANAAVGKPTAKRIKSITRLMLTPYLPQDGGGKAVRLHIERRK